MRVAISLYPLFGVAVERVALRAEQLCDAEREVDGLACVEARIARRRVAEGQMLLEDVLYTSTALGDVITREFDMNSAWPGSLLLMHGEEPSNLSEHVIEVPGLAAIFGGEGVPVHWVALPDHHVAGIGDRPQYRRKASRYVCNPKSSDQRQPPGDALRVEPFAELQCLVRGCGRSEFYADWILHAREKFDMRAIDLARAFADPEHVRRAVVPISSQRVATGERLFVLEEQCFVT